GAEDHRRRRQGLDLCRPGRAERWQQSRLRRRAPRPDQRGGDRALPPGRPLCRPPLFRRDQLPRRPIHRHLAALRLLLLHPVRAGGRGHRARAMKLIVIGAGLSGLVTALEVQDAGHEVVLLEARDRVGGRVFGIRGGLRDGQYADVGAEMIYHGQANVMGLCEKHGLELTTEFSLGTEVPDMVFHGEKLSREASAEIVDELRSAIRNTPPGFYETVAQWLRRTRVSQPVELLLTAIAQGTPASPLRVADAQELNVELSWGKGFRKIRGGNDRLPKALAIR